MNIYQYIAVNDAYGARALCNKYGISLQQVSPDDIEAMGLCLEQMVSHYGEEAFKDILSLHPDKDVLVETYGNQQITTMQKCDGDCACKKSEKKATKSIETYLQSAQNQQSGLFHQNNNTFLIAAALILAVAIVVK